MKIIQSEGDKMAIPFKMTYDSRNRSEIEKLAVNTKALAYKWYQYCIDNQIDILIYETVRSLAQQQANVKNGASQTLRSYHLVGQALDFVPVNGKAADWDGFGKEKAKKAVSYAKKIGFNWGGDWKTLIDKPHLEYHYKGYGTDPFTSGTKVSVSNNGDATIKGIQSKMNSLYLTQITVDGYYGPSTKKALLKGFQKELNSQFGAGLTVDGVWGQNTKAHAVTVKEGNKGNLTYILQSMIYCLGHDPHGVDGIFGSGTTSAVKHFQAEEKLSVDGIAGTNTWSKLFS